MSENGNNGDKALMKRDIEQLEEKVDKVIAFFSAGGICEKSRRKVDGHAIHIIIQYGLLVIILVAILGLAFKGM